MSRCRPRSNFVRARLDRARGMAEAPAYADEPNIQFSGPNPPRRSRLTSINTLKLSSRLNIENVPLSVQSIIWRDAPFGSAASEPDCWARRAPSERTFQKWLFLTTRCNGTALRARAGWCKFGVT